MEGFENISIATFSNLLEEDILALDIVFSKLHKGVFTDLDRLEHIFLAEDVPRELSENSRGRFYLLLLL